MSGPIRERSSSAGCAVPLATQPLAAAASAAAAPPPDFARLQSLWSQILIECGEKRPKIAALLGRCRIRESPQPGSFSILLESEFNLGQLRDTRRARDLEALVAEVTGARWRIGFELDASPGQEAQEAGRPGATGEAAGDGRPGARPGARPDLRENPLVKKSIEIFRGRIV